MKRTGVGRLEGKLALNLKVGIHCQREQRERKERRPRHVER